MFRNNDGDDVDNRVKYNVCLFIADIVCLIIVKKISRRRKAVVFDSVAVFSNNVAFVLFR